MSKIIVLNSGSSSLKFQLYDYPSYEVLTSGQAERIGQDHGIFSIKIDGEKIVSEPVFPTHQEAVDLLLKSLVEYKIVESLDEIVAAGHRIVQGGPYFSDSVEADEEVVKKVEELIAIAPLHNKAHLICYDAFRKALPNIRHVFVFDTAFHQTMKPEAYIYPVPYEWYEDFKVRKYGAHGTSHKFVAEETAKLCGKDVTEMNIITCHLGNGASITAVKNGKVIDTSMGLSPLGGIMMGTRCGDIDPTVVYYMEEKLHCTPEEMETYLNKKSGMLGVSGISSDNRDIEAAYNEGNERAILTYNVYANRVVNIVGGYAAQLGHVDAISFTAGLGENATLLRQIILQRLSEFFGLSIDYAKNAECKRGVDGEISLPDSKTRVFIVSTNEELAIVKDVVRILYNK